ncbi:polysaccharide biosynthesis/export family protein [Haoranjiania flava]|uniref:Polysaccharide biosynthesis/export family protein n=1 Tax=Haoranjiania flava TaxID=1856322 RepID=A0AAE3LKH1_9BACT|nr:polysaccharide biosynthesis/export family protein [Haoranjiania flava]MCU7694588.1 polysaccharide biosynthesis/export family protein [Haoranjiania flava]
MSDLRDSIAISEAILNKVDAKIKEGDILSISVNTLSPESNALFNKGEMITPGISSTPNLTAYSGATTLSNVGYLVDKDGNINFPVIGVVKLDGLTIEQARQKLTTEIAKQTKNPIVNIRFMNFKVTVVGEVMKPGTFNISNDKINILEALGMAGDMTPYGKRENVLVIREDNGVRTLGRVNMNTRNLTQSPFFYLQQNDVVYVAPQNAQKMQQVTNSDYKIISLATASVSIIAVILSSILNKK